MISSRAMRRLLLGGVGMLCALPACTSQVGPDSHTEVFKTAQEAAAARKQKLLSEWKDLAARLANAARPDIHSAPETQKPFSLRMEADGLVYSADLSPLTDKLLNAQGREREPILNLLRDHFAAIDRQRLLKLGFEGARPLLYPVLASNQQTLAMIADLPPGSKQTPLAIRVVIDLNWLPVVRWPGGEGHQTPLDASLLSAWHVSEARLADAALANLKRDFIASLTASGGGDPASRGGDPASATGWYDTIDLPGMGRYGTLRAGINPAIILLPEFLTTVRRNWNTADDLILFLPSRSTMNFIESGNKKLFAALWPQWKELYQKVSEPLQAMPLLCTQKGLVLFSPPPTPPATPASKPATAPATKRVYIVN